MARPLPINNNGSTLQDRAKPWVAVEKVPVLIPKAKIDPRQWQAYDRNTPGMTNRVLEDRWDDQSRVDSNLSTPSEIASRSDTTVEPEALRRQGYMQWALIAATGIVAYMILSH